jgi:hypothetical protein
MRKRIKPGMTCEVTIGSGLDSGRAGVVVDPRGKSDQFFREIEPGRYTAFDPRRESLLVDKNGEYFTMFNTRLLVKGE